LTSLCSSDSPSSAHLARSAAGNVRALGALHTTSDAVARPGPVGARTLRAQNVHISTLGRNRTLNILHSQTRDRHTSGRSTSGAAVLVVLLNHDTVLCNVLERNVLVGDAADGAGSAVDGLDAHAVVRVGDGGRQDLDVLDGVVRAAADGADADAVAAGAGAAGESDVSA